MLKIWCHQVNDMCSILIQRRSWKGGICILILNMEVKVFCLSLAKEIDCSLPSQSIFLVLNCKECYIDSHVSQRCEEIKDPLPQVTNTFLLSVLMLLCHFTWFQWYLSRRRLVFSWALIDHSHYFVKAHMGLLVKYLFFIYISGKGNFIFHVKASLIGCFSLTPLRFIISFTGDQRCWQWT